MKRNEWKSGNEMEKQANSKLIYSFIHSITNLLMIVLCNSLHSLHSIQFKTRSKIIQFNQFIQFIQSMILSYLRWENQRFQLIQMKLRHHQTLLPKRHPIRHELPYFLLNPRGISALVLRAEPLQPFHPLLSTRLIVRFVLQLHAEPRVLFAEVFDLFLQRLLLLLLPLAAILRDFAVFLQAALALLLRLRALDGKGRDARTRWKETFTRGRS